MSKRQKQVRNFILGTLAVFAGLIFAAWAAIAIIKPGPEGKLVLASGGSEGAYNDLAIAYQKQMAKYGVEVELRPTTAGSATLRALFVDEKSDIDAAFIKGGVAGSLQGRLATDKERASHDRQIKALFSVGRMFYEPIYVFYRGPEQVKSLSEFKGRKIAIGNKEGGARRIARTLLRSNGVDEKNSTFIEKEIDADGKGLTSGAFDVAFIVLPPESNTIFKLMRNPDIFLMNFAVEAEAYVARFPHLTKLVMHQGSIEFAPDIPSADITLLSTTAALVVKKSVHPSIVSLLADAVIDNPRKGFDRDGEPVLFHKAGEFPNAKDPEFEISRDALSLYKTGDLPFLLRSLAPLNQQLGIPFWVTAYLHKHGTSTVLLLIPILSILLPLIRILPSLYAWTVRRRLYVWYRQMKALENQLDHKPTAAQLADAKVELERLDRAVSRVRVPVQFSDQFYDLRGHIDFIRRRLEPRAFEVQAAAE
ncbi:MAG: TAXI family TRAP transporter solute-binding subunit [Hyphomicrobiaceae bacterium]